MRFVERYVTFLRAELPKLRARKLKAKLWRALRRGDVLEVALAHVARNTRSGLCLEFGVYEGRSITHSATRLPAHEHYGFDSFDGFPDDGRIDWPQDFGVVELPSVPSNVRLIEGWFSDTLPGFLREHSAPICFINIDCDLYSSTRDVFRCLERAGRLEPGVTIYFDELLNYDGYLWNEMLALFEMLERTGYGVAWLALHRHVYSVEESIDLLEGDGHPKWAELIDSGHRQQAALVLTERGGWQADDDPTELATRLQRITERRFAHDPSAIPW